MTTERSPQQRWFLAGCVLTTGASLGLITFPLTQNLSFLNDAAVFALVCILTVLMGLGTTLAVFNVKRH